MRPKQLIAAPLVLIALALAACGEEDVEENATSETLRTAFSADPAPLDPDTYYEAEGLAITTAAYEGLLKYAPDSNELEGELATDWDVSQDGLEYTFQLREGVTFSDGELFDSEAAKASLERRTALKGGPSYMLSEVDSIETPSSAELVVRLKEPVAAFLDYLASPYGPVMTSPTALEQNEEGGDRGAKWLAGHSAGTGPYELTSVEPSEKYVLEANDEYWGDAPGFGRVEFAVVPDFAQQRIQLEGGQLDLLLHGQSTQDIEAIGSNSELQVQNLSALFKQQVFVNPDSQALGSPEAREALQGALDKEALTAEVLGDRGVPSTDIYPAGMLPEGEAPDGESSGDPDLAGALADSQGEAVEVGWYSDLTSKRLADLIQVQLQDAGLDATTREFKPATLFALPTDPSQRPDLLTAAFNPDAAHPDTFARVYYYTDAPVNLLGCSVPEADALLDRALAEPTREASEELSAEAGRAYAESDCWLNIADVNDTYAARSGIGGFEKELPWVFTPRLASLQPE